MKFCGAPKLSVPGTCATVPGTKVCKHIHVLQHFPLPKLWENLLEEDANELRKKIQFSCVQQCKDDFMPTRHSLRTVLSVLSFATSAIFTPLFVSIVRSRTASTTKFAALLFPSRYRSVTGLRSQACVCLVLVISSLSFSSAFGLIAGPLGRGTPGPRPSAFRGFSTQGGRPSSRSGSTVMSDTFSEGACSSQDTTSVRKGENEASPELVRVGYSMVPASYVATIPSFRVKQLTLILAYDDKQMLLGMKKRGFGEGKWNGFGGKVEAGESIEAAALRELQEESGCGAAAGALRRRGLLTFVFENDPTVMQVHLFSLPLAQLQGAPAESEEMRPKLFPVAPLPAPTRSPSTLDPPSSPLTPQPSSLTSSSQSSPPHPAFLAPHPLSTAGGLSSLACAHIPKCVLIRARAWGRACWRGLGGQLGEIPLAEMWVDDAEWFPWYVCACMRACWCVCVRACWSVGVPVR